MYDDDNLHPQVHLRSAADPGSTPRPNRSQRRADVREHRHRARQLARAQGCTCRVELLLNPIDGRPVWAQRPDTDRRVYLTKHDDACPLYVARYDPDAYVIVIVIVIPPEPGCSR